MIGFILGLLVGGVVGFITAALLTVGNRYEDKDRGTWTDED